MRTRTLMIMVDDTFGINDGINISKNRVSEMDGSWEIDLSQTGFPFCNMNGMKGNKAQ